MEIISVSGRSGSVIVSAVRLPQARNKDMTTADKEVMNVFIPEPSYQYKVVILLEPVYPPSAVKLTVKLTRVAVDGQFSVTVPVAEDPGLMVPRLTGVPDASVTAPEPTTSEMAVILVMVAFVAAARPVLVRVKLTRTVDPETVRVPTLTAILGASGVKFATMFAGPFIVRFCGFVLPVSGPPEKLANW